MQKCIGCGVEFGGRKRKYCGICGERTQPTSPVYSAHYPSIDHVIPLSAGGPHVATNLQCACFMCNSLKGAAV